MRLSLLLAAAVCSIIIAGCGPAVEREYLYLAREDDTVRALTLRLTGSEIPATEIAEYNLVAPDAAFDTPLFIYINSRSIEKSGGDTALLEEYSVARTGLLRYELGAARERYSAILAKTNDPAVRYETAITSLLAGDFDEAQTNLEDNVGFEFLRACRSSATGDLYATEDKLLSRLLNEPEDRRSKYLLGEILRRQRRFTDARTACFGLLLDDETDVIAELTRAAIKRAIREEMNDVKKALDENKTGKEN